MGDVRLLDGEALVLGTDYRASLKKNIADPDAYVVMVDLPVGGAVAVPVLAVGVRLDNVNLGMFDGLTQPMVATVDADKDSYVGFHFSADDTPVVRLRVGASGTVRSHVIPDVASDTIALLDATQTFTNKTLTAPSLTNPTVTTALNMVQAPILLDTLASAGARVQDGGAEVVAFRDSTNTRGINITLTAAGVQTIAASAGSLALTSPYVLDNVLLRLGTDGDFAAVLNSAGLAADEELANVIVGTSDHQGTAADSLVLSNVTANGDILGLVNNGGNSLEWLLVDASAQVIYLGHGFNHKLVLNDPLDGNIADSLVYYGASGATNSSVLTLRYQAGAGAGSSAWFGAGKGSGTQASPLATVDTARVAEFVGLGWDGTNWRGLAQYGVEAVGATSATNRGGKMYFETRYQSDPDDVTAFRKWMTLGHDGQLILDQTIKPASAANQSLLMVLKNDAGVTGLRLIAGNDTAENPAFLSLVHHGGTNAAPTATTSGMSVGQITFGGYTTAITGAALIEGVATELWSATAKGTKLQFKVVDNTTLVQDIRLTIDQDGQVIAGVAGTFTGIFAIEGSTSGRVQLTVAATAGTWTLTLPTGVAGVGGYQLTDAAGDGVTSWTAAASRREYKQEIEDFADYQGALRQILQSPLHTFRYRPGYGTGDYDTRYLGIMADESPWATHFSESIINPVNTVGYMVAGFRAHEDEITSIRRQMAALQERLEDLRTRAGV